jgi:RimJ/RimL family protein N-acetyltransferase
MLYMVVNIKDYKKKLETKRLNLIPFSLKYKDFFYENSKDKQLTKYTTIIGSVEKPTMLDVEKYIRKTILRKNGLFYILLLKENNLPIGCTGLNKIDLENKTCSTFSWLSKKYVGHGYMYEAKKNLFLIAFNKLNLRKIETDCDPRNTKIIKHLLSLGFKKEGLLRENYKFKGKFVDNLVLGLLKKEYKNK